MRVFQLAKEFKLTSKDLIKKLNDLGIPVKSHMNELDPDTLTLVKEELAPKTETAVKEKTAEKAEPQPVTEKEEPAPQEEEKQEEEEIPPEQIIEIEFPITAKELSLKLNIKPNELISKLISLGFFASINQNLDRDTVQKVLHIYQLTMKEISIAESQLSILENKYKQVDDFKNLVPRAPVVTFMGHVDHGKTLLLDTIRKTKVVETEFGGITQHIGAYKVSLPKGDIVFLDTPGHEAFTAMRARGTNITDIAVLVVAADDGVMPQTLEAIDHARAADVSIVVAVNKIDLPAANPERVKRQLVQHGVKLEGWGGDVIVCEVSAMTKSGIDHFLEMLLLEAELLELKANPKRRAWGSVVESKLTKDRGPEVTVLVRNGTLKLGDPIICGMHYGKAKALLDDRGHRIHEAGPATPVEILGFTGTPDAGAEFFVTENEREAKEISAAGQSNSRRRLLESHRRMTLEDLYAQISEGLKELKLIIKGDTQGSVEALSLALEQISNTQVGINIIHSAVGDITESDAALALASNAVIIGFHVKADPKVRDICRKEKIDLRLYNIIYQAIEEVTAAVEGLLEPKLIETITGRAKVQQVFKVSKSGIVAGCIVTEGKLIRNSNARIIRDGNPIHEDQIVSLKRFKDEVKEAAKGYECGLKIGKFDTYQVGDIFETYIIEKEKQKL